MRTVLLFLLVACVGCRQTSSTHESDNSQAGVLAIAPEETTLLTLSDLVDTLRYVRLETRDDNLIGQVTQVIPLQDKIAVVDGEISHAVFFFDKAGKYLYKLEARGAGPEEYAEIQSVAVDEAGDRLFIYDAKQREILCYTLSGDYRESHQVHKLFTHIAYVGHEVIAAYCDYGRNYGVLGREEQVPLMVLYNLRTHELHPYCYVSKEMGAGEVLITQALSVDGVSGMVTCAYPLCNQVYAVQSDTIFPQYTVDFGAAEQSRMERHIQFLIDNTVQPQELIAGGKSCPNFFQLTFVLQSKELLYLLYNNFDAGKIGVYLYDKTTRQARQGIAVREWPIQNDTGVAFWMIPVAIAGRELYTVIPSMYLDTVKDACPELAGMTSDDNPVIMITRMK